MGVYMEIYEEGLVLESENIILRDLREDDALAIYHNINHDKKVLKYYLAPYIEDEKEASVKRIVDYCKEEKIYCFTIVLKETNEVIGMINQVDPMAKYTRTVELGYAIGSKYWNKGYVTEALKLMISLLFNKGVHKVSCGAIPENKASIEVMKKCGMVYEGKNIDDIYYHDRYYDTEYYYILEDMFHVEHNKE